MMGGGQGRSEGKDSGPSTSHLWTTVVPLFFAGVSGLAFVAAAGGLITVVRFRAAGLPSELAVSAVPQGLLVAQGAELLGDVFLVGLILLAVMHWWADPRVLRLLSAGPPRALEPDVTEERHVNEE